MKKPVPNTSISATDHTTPRLSFFQLFTYTKRAQTNNPLVRPGELSTTGARKNNRKKQQSRLEASTRRRQLRTLSASETYPSISTYLYNSTWLFVVLAVAEHAVHAPEIHTGKTAKDCTQLRDCLVGQAATVLVGSGSLVWTGAGHLGQQQNRA